ncbi:MAG: YHS domain-containing protein [Syntrophaceae bacterium]|nr:YHS domain-containing protein [Syntrophaceae bacterium]
MNEERQTVKCPVCSREMEVGSQVAKLYGAVRSAPRATSAYEGKDYYFDSKACKKEFDESPEQFIKK